MKNQPIDLAKRQELLDKLQEIKSEVYKFAKETLQSRTKASKWIERVSAYYVPFDDQTEFSFSVSNDAEAIVRLMKRNSLLNCDDGVSLKSLPQTDDEWNEVVQELQTIFDDLDCFVGGDEDSWFSSH